MARGLDDLYHQANPKVARITGTTTTSMMAVELTRRSSSCDAIGPCGSSTPCWLQEQTNAAAHVSSQRSKPGRRGPCRASDSGLHAVSGIAECPSSIEASGTEDGTRKRRLRRVNSQPTRLVKTPRLANPRACGAVDQRRRQPIGLGAKLAKGPETRPNHPPRRGAAGGAERGPAATAAGRRE